MWIQGSFIFLQLSTLRQWIMITALNMKDTSSYDIPLCAAISYGVIEHADATHTMVFVARANRIEAGWRGSRSGSWWQYSDSWFSLYQLLYSRTYISLHFVSQTALDSTPNPLAPIRSVYGAAQSGPFRAAPFRRSHSALGCKESRCNHFHSTRDSGQSKSGAKEYERCEIKHPPIR